MIIQTRGDIIKIKGVLTENQWPAIRSAVGLLLEDHPRGVVIDASGLTEISEAGARTFLDASNFIQAHNARVVVAGIPDEILAEIRKIPGVRSQLVVASTLEEAQASLESGGTESISDGKHRPAVLVPLVGAWQKALGFAAAEASSRKAEIFLLYVLQIPRNMPLGVPMPDMEQDAQNMLSEAERLLKRSGVRVRRLTTRTRDVIDGVIKFAADVQPELIVVAYFKGDVTQGRITGSMLSAFCQDAPGDIALYCVKE